MSESSSKDGSDSDWASHKVKHIGGTCGPSPEIKMQSVSSGGWGTKSHYVNICQNCGAKSEQYTLN